MPKWYEAFVEPVFTAAGQYLGGPAGAAAGNAAGKATVSFIGGKKGKKETSSYQNIPPEVLQAYLGTYIPDAMNLYKSGPNEYQKQATASLGGGLEGLMQELSGYTNLYEDNVSHRVLQGIEDDAARQRERVKSQFAGNGISGLYGTPIAQELAFLDKNKQAQLANYKHDMARANFDSALGLRRQTLADLMTAGEQPHNRLKEFGSLIGAFPQGAVGTSYQMPEQMNWGNQGAGVVKSLAHLFDNYQNNKGSYVPAYDQDIFGQGQNIGGQMPWRDPNVSPWQGGGGQLGIW